MASPARSSFLTSRRPSIESFDLCAWEGEVTDQSIALLMHRLQMPKDALKVLRGIMKEPCALQQAGMGWLQSEEA